MAELIHHRPKSTTNCLSGCLGFPNKQQLSRKKADAKKSSQITPCLSWSKFRLKRSSSTKTVPIDSTVSSENINLSFKCPNPTEEDHLTLNQITTAATVSSHNPFPKETRINDRRQSRTHSDDATCQKRLSFRRKIDSIRTASHPAKPVIERANVAVSRSTAFPDPNRVKWVVGSPSTQPQRENTELDPIVGMSIVTVTLLIMLLWGRLCAILCTSAWFYFAPRLRSNGINGSGSKQPDLNSEEYKKRVVLEGFLQRNNHHRTTL